MLGALLPYIAGAVLSVGGALLSKSGAPKYPKNRTVPKTEDMIDVLDFVSGVQVITRVGINGKKERVIERLPRSPEEQKLYDLVGEIMESGLRNIQTLAELDSIAALDYSPFINLIGDLNQERKADIANLIKIPDISEFVSNFKSTEKDHITSQFSKIRDSKRDELVRLGYGVDSTAWAESSAAIDAQESQALRGVDVRADLAGHDLLERDIKGKAMAFDLTEAARQAQLQGESAQLGVEQNRLTEREARRQKQIEEQSLLLQQASKMYGEDVAKGLASIAPQTGQNMYNAQLAEHKASSQQDMQNYMMAPPSFREIAGNYLGYLGKHAMTSGTPTNEYLSNVGKERGGSEGRRNDGGIPYDVYRPYTGFSGLAYDSTLPYTNYYK